MTLTRDDGTAAMRFAGSSAHDATGRDLQGWLEVNESRLILRVDDRGAIYPLMSDPFTELAKLTAQLGASDEFGYSVAVSGETVVVSAPFHTVGVHTNQGEDMYSFSQAVDGQQARPRAQNSIRRMDQMPKSVAISGDTIAIGAYGHNASRGEAYLLPGYFLDLLLIKS